MTTRRPEQGGRSGRAWSMSFGRDQPGRSMSTGRMERAVSAASSAATSEAAHRPSQRSASLAAIRISTGSTPESGNLSRRDVRAAHAEAAVAAATSASARASSAVRSAACHGVLSRTRGRAGMGRALIGRPPGRTGRGRAVPERMVGRGSPVMTARHPRRPGLPYTQAPSGVSPFRTVTDQGGTDRRADRGPVLSRQRQDVRSPRHRGSGGPPG